MLSFLDHVRKKYCLSFILLIGQKLCSCGQVVFFLCLPSFLCSFCLVPFVYSWCTLASFSLPFFTTLFSIYNVFLCAYQKKNKKRHGSFGTQVMNEDNEWLLFGLFCIDVFCICVHILSIYLLMWKRKKQKQCMLRKAENDCDVQNRVTNFLLYLFLSCPVSDLPFFFLCVLWHIAISLMTLIFIATLHRVSGFSRSLCQWLKLLFVSLCCQLWLLKDRMKLNAISSSDFIL